MLEIHNYKCSCCNKEYKKTDIEHIELSIFDKPVFKIVCSNCNNTDIITIKRKYKDTLEVDKTVTKRQIKEYYEYVILKQIDEAKKESYKRMLQDKYDKYKMALNNV